MSSLQAAVVAAVHREHLAAAERHRLVREARALRREHRRRHERRVPRPRPPFEV